MTTGALGRISLALAMAVVSVLGVPPSPVEAYAVSPSLSEPHFTGTVRSATTGEPLPGVEVRIYDAATVWQSGTANPVSHTLTDAEGRYHVPVAAGSTQHIIAFCDLSGTYRDVTWPSSGRHLGDAWGWYPAPDARAPLQADAYLQPLDFLRDQRVERVAGSDRYATSIDISRRNFSTSRYAILATGADFPDALAAAPLAGSLGAPILLTEPDRLSPALAAELKRLGARDVIVLGGTASITERVDTALRSAGFSVRRISGRDRYEVASKIALEVYAETPNKEPLVVRGDVFADALAVAPFAYMQARPILLCPTTGMTPAVASAWSKMRGGARDTALFVGGMDSITDELYDGFLGISGPVLDQRNFWIFDSALADRYGTAAAVVRFFHHSYYRLDGGFDFIGVASGTTYPDALAGGAASGYMGGPLVLTRGDALSPAAARILRTSAPYVTNLQVFGGAATVSEPTVAAARSTLGSAVYDIDTFGRSVQLPVAVGITLASAPLQPAGADLTETNGSSVYTETEGALPTSHRRR